VTRDLSKRLAYAMDLGEATPDQRAQVVDAAQLVTAFEELPDLVQAMVLRWEQGPTPA
jgi:hypothetical protein